MPFSLFQFAARSPFLFHLTDPRNLSRIQRDRRMLAAEALCRQANRAEILRSRRTGHEEISINGESVFIRDQAPLYKGKMQLVGGWTFEQFLASLNERVFFWPSRGNGRPIASGINHFGRYRPEHPVLM